MQPKKYLFKFAQAVSKRSGISINTLLVALPAIFDEMRYTLCEGRYRCITVESFGTLIVKQIPQRHYTRINPDGTTRVIDLPPKLKVTFSPTRNMRNEVEASKFDPTRQSFVLHPDDHPIRTRKSIDNKPKKHKTFFGIKGVVVRDEPKSNIPNREPIILRGKQDEEDK